MKRSLRKVITTAGEWLPNTLLLVGVLVFVQINLPLWAVILVLLSKWQILIGGPKLWLNNMRLHVCDLSVSLSLVALIIIFNEYFITQLVLVLMYLLWLVFLRNLKGENGLAIQAILCQFFGLTFIFLLGRTLPITVVVLLSWLIGLIAADHFLAAFEDRVSGLLIMLWGLVSAQFAWLLAHWLIVYSLFDGVFLVPQAAVILPIISYSLAHIYRDHHHKQLKKVRLFEYVAVTLVIFIVVIVGTRWDVRL